MPVRHYVTCGTPKIYMHYMQRIVIVFMYFFGGRSSLTRDKIAETYSSHGHKTEVKTVEKIPIVFPQHKHTSATGEI